MHINHISAFDGCYVMQHEDIERFANTLADGFRGYNLFEYVCNGDYNHDKMRLFWAVSIALVADNAICIADSKSVNSVLIYVKPKSKESGPLEYFKAGGLKLVFKMGLRGLVRLTRVDTEVKQVAQRCKSENDGYLLAFATRIDKQGQHYGKPLMEALMRYLDDRGEGCYLETMKVTNVELYKRFSFQLIEQTSIKSGGLNLFAMRRPPKAIK